jgi:CRISPR-associated protein Cas1
MQLVINSPGTFITQKDECFRLKQKERVFDISPLKVESINKHLDETTRYRRRNLKRRYIVQHEAHRLANILLTEEDEKRPEWLEIKEF